MCFGLFRSQISGRTNEVNEGSKGVRSTLIVVFWAVGPSALPCAGAAPPQRPPLSTHVAGSFLPSWHAGSAFQPSWRLPTKYATRKPHWRRGRKFGLDRHCMRLSSYLTGLNAACRKRGWTTVQETDLGTRIPPVLTLNAESGPAEFVRLQLQARDRNLNRHRRFQICCAPVRRRATRS